MASDPTIGDIIIEFVKVHWEGIIAIFLGLLALYFGRWGRKMQKMNLIPDCTLRIDAGIGELREPGKKEGTGKFMLRNTVYIYRSGGIVKYPKFHHILLLKNPFGINHATTRIIQGTPMLDVGRGGSWDIDIPLSKEQLDRIDCIYLALECTDREEKDYFTVTKFEYIFNRWELKMSSFRTRRKRFWNKQIMEMFKKEPRKWIEKYGKKGKIVNE